MGDDMNMSKASSDSQCLHSTRTETCAFRNAEDEQRSHEQANKNKTGGMRQTVG